MKYAGTHCPGQLFWSIIAQKSYCFQVQMVTCCDVLSVFLYKIEIYSIDSSKRIDNFAQVLNFNWLFLKLNQFIYNYTKYDSLVSYGI